MPPTFDGSPEDRRAVEAERRAGRHRRQPGRRRLQSSMIFVPLLDKDPRTGKRIDYHGAVARARGQDPRQVRAREGGRRGAKAPAKIKVHVIGFAKLDRRADRRAGQGDGVLRRGRADRHRDHLRLHALRAQHGARHRVLAGGRRVAARSGRAARLRARPYSILVPFLVFAIGVSHGAQKMNGIMQDIGRGTHKLVAARYTFRRLFLAGLTALLADAVGFAVLMVIDIPVIRELAHHREHRRRRADLHEPAAAAGAPLLYRRERGGGAAQPRRRARGNSRSGRR